MANIAGMAEKILDFGMKPITRFGNGLLSAGDALAKRGSFANASFGEVIGGMVGGATKEALNALSAPLYVGGAILGGMGLVGAGAVRGVGRGIKGFAKGTGLADAASSVGRGLNEAGGKIKTGFGNLKKKTIGQSAPKATLRGTRTNGGIEFAMDGHTYKRVKNPNYHGNGKDGGQSQWMYTDNGSAIDIKQFKDHYQNFKNAGGVFDETAEENLKNAASVATAETAERAGIDLMQFANDHPFVAGGALLGGGFLLSELLDED